MIQLQGFHLLWHFFPNRVYLSIYYDIYTMYHIPSSLAVTFGISIDLFYSRYLDVSLRWLCSQVYLCLHTHIHACFRISKDRRYLHFSLWLFVVLNVLILAHLGIHLVAFLLYICMYVCLCIAPIWCNAQTYIHIDVCTTPRYP